MMKHADHLIRRIGRLKALLRLAVDLPTRAAIGHELAVLQTGLIARSSGQAAARTV